MVTHKEIEALIALSKKHDLAELHVQFSAKSSVTIKHQTQPMVPAGVTSSAQLSSAPVVNARNQIKAPMVGTVYLRPKPEQDTYVSKGQAVKKGDTLCLIEAMKMFNKVIADRDGVIADILVDDAQAVAFDTPLFAWQD